MNIRKIILALTVAISGTNSAIGLAQGLLSNSDMEKILAETSNKQVIGLGEVFHTSGGFYKVKAQVIQHLISQGNLRNLAWEESWNNGDMVNSWLKSCQEDPADVVGRLRFIWRSEEIKDLFSWLCAWNQGHPEDQVSFMGFDIQDTWSDAEIIERSLGASEPGLVKSIRENCFGASSHSKEEYIASPDYLQLSQALNGTFSTFSKDRDAACRAAVANLRQHDGQRDNRPLSFALTALIGNHKAMTTRISGNVAQADQTRDSAMFQLLSFQ
jgi:erythromycin esterase-like protein